MLNPTVWRPTDGNGEATSIDKLGIITLAGERIITLSGELLSTLQGMYEKLPATYWATVELLPSTRWRPTDGNGEATQSDDSSLATESDLVITDEVDAPLQIEAGAYAPLPSTVWVMDEGV